MSGNLRLLIVMLLFVAFSTLVCACGDGGDAGIDGDSEPELSDGDADLPENETPADGDSEDEAESDFEAESVENGEEAGDMQLRIMSFNLRLGVAPDGENHWSKRKSIVINFLNAETPDVFGIQEGWEFQLEDIVNGVPGYAWVGVSRNNNILDEFSAILYRTGRFDVLESNTFWLSDTPEEPGTKFSDQQSCVRICTWAHLYDRESGRDFYAFNTHYDYVTADEIQEKSSALIATRIKEIAGDKPVFLTGDFNVPVGSDAYLILTGGMQYEGAGLELYDPWTELGVAEEGSFHDFTGVATSDSRIDWILHSAHFSAVSAEVEHYSEEGFYPSDHFPISAEIEIVQ